jgi:transposase-like protein
MGRRHFTREFKLEAVKLVLERGVCVSQVAKDLDIGASVVGRWVRENLADKKHAFPGRGQMKPDDAEVARLKRELIRVKAERDILKKPLGSSSRTQREVRGDREVPAHLALGVAVQNP